MFLNEREKKSGELAWMMWWSRIRACQRFRSEHPFGDTVWERYYSTYKGIQWEDLDDIYDISSDNLPERITVNVTASTILTMVPFLVNERAEFDFEAKRPAGVVGAMLREKLLNDEFEKKEIHSELKKVVYDGHIIGHGVFKSGFTAQVDQAAASSVGDIEYDELIKDESIYGKRCDPRNIWYDYAAPRRNMASGRFVIERYYKYVPDLIENTSYKSSVREKIRDGTYDPKCIDSIPEYKQEPDAYRWLNYDSFRSYETQIAELYEVWDKKYNQVLTFCEGILEPLRVIDNPYSYLNGEFPYIQYDFIYMPDEYWGCGVPRFIEQVQFELNRHRTFAYNHRRKCSSSIWEVTEDVDDEEREKLPDAEDGTYIIVPAVNSIRRVDSNPLPEDYILQESLFKSDINEMTGLDALARGANLQSRATLGEVQTRTNISGLKLNERVAEVDRLFHRAGIHCDAHICSNYTRSSVVRLVGLQGNFWVEVSDEDLRDQVDIKMETVSAPRRNPETDLQQRIQIFQYAMQLLPLIQANVIPPTEINFVELLKWTLEGFERQDIGRFFRSALIPVNPLNQFLMNSQEFAGQIQGQGGGGQLPAGPADMIRSLASGNTSGMQFAGVG